MGDFVNDLIQSLSSVQVEKLSDNERRALLKSARKLCSNLETPWETLLRLGWTEPSQMAVLKTCSDLELFPKWQASTTAQQTPEELCKILGPNVCDPELLVRCLRLLAETGILHNPTPNHYQQTRFTRAFADTPAFPATLRYTTSVQLPVLHALPQHLAGLHYRNPTSADPACFPAALQTPLSFFQWFSARPSLQADFNAIMTLYASQQPHWSDIFPASALDAPQLEGEAAVLVDVGGGVGHDLAEFAKRFPALAGPRLVLQDQEVVIAGAVVGPEVARVMALDFFGPQPVIGAAAYYLHNVLHDWADPEARKILEQLREAMVPGRSRILIHEIVMQQQTGLLEAASSDIVLMAMVNAKERSEDAWRCLIASAGLTVKKIHQIPQAVKSVIEVVVD